MFGILTIGFADNFSGIGPWRTGNTLLPLDFSPSHPRNHVEQIGLK
jgi:hypothetical protein